MDAINPLFISTAVRGVLEIPIIKSKCYTYVYIIRPIDLGTVDNVTNVLELNDPLDVDIQSLHPHINHLELQEFHSAIYQIFLHSFLLDQTLSSMLTST
jgi:hypothetical protein